MEKFRKILLFTLILCFILTPSIPAVVQIENVKNDTNSIKMLKNEPSYKSEIFNKPDNFRVQKDIQNIDIVNNEILLAESDFSLEVNSNTKVQNSVNSYTSYHDRVKSIHNSDGSITSEFYIKPTYYLDAENKQQFIDTTIEKFSISKSDIETDLNLIDYDYRNIKNNLKVYFNSDYRPNEKNILSIQDSNNQQPLTWQPVGFYIEPNNNFNELDANSILEMVNPDGNLNHVTGTVNNNCIEYNNIYPGFTDKYTILPNKVKHDLILSNEPLLSLDENSIISYNKLIDQDLKVDYSFNYYGILNLPSTLTPAVNNIKQTQPFAHDNDIELVSENGKIIYKITKPIAYELNSESTQIDCKYTLIPLSNLKATDPETSSKYLPNTDWSETLVILSTELAWLQDSNRNYPISIDPDIELQPDGEVGLDTYLTKGNATNPETSIRNYGKSRELKVSLAGPSIYSKENLYHRSILKFPGVDNLDEEAQIISAKLILQSKGNSDSLSISIFQLFDKWIEGNGTESELFTTGATWNHSGYNIWLGGNFDGYKTDADTVQVAQPLYYGWDVTDIVENWVTLPGTNYGFLLSGTDDEDVVKTFHSSDATYYSVRPMLEITYNTPPRSTGIETITVSEDVEEEVVYLSANPSKGIDGLFYDPDIFLIPKEDGLSFKMWNGTGYQSNAGGNVLYTSSNLTVEFRTDDKLYIKPSESEVDGLDVIPVQVKDQYTDYWLNLDLTYKIIAVNDPPEIISIGGRTVHDKTKTVELKATEGIYASYNINIKDPDNKEYIEEEISNKSDGAPANLSFRWEKWKTNTFVITPTENNAFISFSPDNSVVGTFYMNITVFDTTWNHSKVPPKDELSNDTVTIIFTISNINNAPSKVRIIEPKLNDEFSADDIITFRGKASDPDLLIPDSKEQLTFSWFSDLDGFMDYGQEIKNKLSKGKHLISLRVVDEDGKKAERNITILVRNRATIDNKNCSNQFKDEEDDVLGFYYSRTGEDEFNVQRGTFPQFNIFIDIVELSTSRYKNYLFINLTVNQDLLLQEDSSNYKYRFSIYLMRPNHQEDTIDLKNIGYDSKRFETLYRPDPTEYYGLFGKNDGEISEDGTKLVIRKHLGDLENGEGIDVNLQPDFTVFATIKVELKQHPGDSFEHVICYDSAGDGAQLAPYPKKTETVVETKEEGQDYGLIIFLFMVVIIIIVIIFIVLYSRLTKKAKAKEEEKIIDTTKFTPGTQVPVTPMGVPAPMGMPFNINMGRPGFPIPPPPMLPMVPQQPPQGQHGMLPLHMQPPLTPNIGGKLPTTKTKKTKGKKK